MMLLLAVLCVAAFCCTAFSQPAKAGSVDINDYLGAALAEANEWEGSFESVMRNPSIQPFVGSTTEFGTPIGYQLMQELATMKNNEGNREKYETNPTESDIRKESLHKRETVRSMFRPKNLARRQFVIDPIGGGYLLRRQSGPEPVKEAVPVKKLFPLDPIGGGYLLKRLPQGSSIVGDDMTLHKQEDSENRSQIRVIGPVIIGEDNSLRRYPNAEKNSFRKGSYLSKVPLDPSANAEWENKQRSKQNLKRSPIRKADFLFRLVPKEELMDTLTTDKSFLNNKDIHMFEMEADPFPIDPIGGGFLLGRSVNYGDENSQIN